MALAFRNDVIALFLNQSIYKPLTKLSNLFIIFPKVFDAITHNLGTLLQRHIKFFIQLSAAARVNDQTGLFSKI